MEIRSPIQDQPLFLTSDLEVTPQSILYYHGLVDAPDESDQRIIYETLTEFLSKLGQSHNEMYHKCLMITPTAMYHIYIANDITQRQIINEFTWQHP